ncbi:MAG: Coenzyme F420 hydrogenase/dehydrogenase, beta subunit C-terminal domain [Ignavibacteriales bacterium]
MPGYEALLDRVIQRGLCTACGACAGVCPAGAVEMRTGNYDSDDPAPVPAGDCVSCGFCESVCPGGGIDMPGLSRALFGRVPDPVAEPLGIVRRSLRVQAGDPQTRRLACTGGAAMALATYAIERGLVDGVLLAGRDQSHPWRSAPTIVTKRQEVLSSVRTAMEVVPVLSLLSKAVVELGMERIGVIGLPCQAHAIRKLQAYPAQLAMSKAVVFTIGLFCNSTVYYMATEHLLKELGGITDLSDIVALDYRAGDWPGMMAVATRDGKILHIASKAAYGNFYSVSNYRRDRCLVCIDFAAEFADIAVGDIFQLRGAQDPRWSATIVRTEAGEKIIAGAQEEGYISCEPHDLMSVLGSSYGWEKAKHASVLRLRQRRRYGWPVPDFGYEPEIRITPRKFFTIS